VITLHHLTLVNYTTEIVTGSGRELRREWREFFEKLKLPIFYRPWFIEAYHGSGIQVQVDQGYIIVRKTPRGDIVAIVPVYLLDPLDPYGDLATCVEMAAMRTKRAVVTHCCHCYDTTLPISIAEADILNAIFRGMASLASRWQAEVFGIVNIDEQDPICQTLATMACARYTMPPRYRMMLTGYPSISEYLQSLRNKVRWELKRQWRRAMADGCSVAVAPSSRTDLWEVVRLCRATAAKYGGEDFYPEIAFHDFLQAAADSTEIVTVHVSDVLVAACICLHDLDCLHIWAAGARYDLCRFSPYYVGFLRCIQYAIESGFRRLEAGRTNSRFKLKHNLTPLQLYGFLAETKDFGGGGEG
jgi:hypothetical protein